MDGLAVQHRCDGRPLVYWNGHALSHVRSVQFTIDAETSCPVSIVVIRFHKAHKKLLEEQQQLIIDLQSAGIDANW